MGQLENTQIFIRIVEAGGIGKAAEQLGLAKSAVSRRLTELEESLGARLFQRSTRVMRLTDAGQLYYARALRIVDEFSELRSQLSGERRELSGRIRVAVPMSFALAHLHRIVADFVAQHPNIDLDIDLSDRQADLIRDGLDFAVRIGELVDSNLIARPLSRMSMHLCAAPDYVKKHGEPTSIDALRRHRLLKYLGSSGNQWTLYDEQGQAHSIGGPGHIVANNGDFLCELAKAGRGIMLSPSFICRQALERGELLEVGRQWQGKRYQVYAVYPQNRHLNQRTQHFMDFLKQQLPPDL